MNEYDIFRQELEEIVIRFNRWMTFIEIVQYIGFALSMLALALLIVRILKERKEKEMKEKKLDDMQVKVGLHVPCRYTQWNESKQKDTECCPAVNCELRCSSCGWNPEVKERRLKRRLG